MVADDDDIRGEAGPPRSRTSLRPGSPARATPRRCGLPLLRRSPLPGDRHVHLLADGRSSRDRLAGPGPASLASSSLGAHDRGQPQHLPPPRATRVRMPRNPTVWPRRPRLAPVFLPPSREERARAPSPHRRRKRGKLLTHAAPRRREVRVPPQRQCRDRLPPRWPRELGLGLAGSGADGCGHGHGADPPDHESDESCTVAEMTRRGGTDRLIRPSNRGNLTGADALDPRRTAPRPPPIPPPRGCQLAMISPPPARPPRAPHVEPRRLCIRGQHVRVRRIGGPIQRDREAVRHYCPQRSLGFDRNPALSFFSTRRRTIAGRLEQSRSSYRNDALGGVVVTAQ